MKLSQFYIDKTSKTPLYTQVEEIISSLLLEEPYSLGEKLPNELEISKELNVSRNTVRKAMYALLNKNLIKRKKNRGTFKNIEDGRIKTTLNNWYSFNEDMKRQNIDFKLFEQSVSLRKPPFDAHEKLNLGVNKKVIKLHRVKGYLEPELYVQSYFHPDLDLVLEDFDKENIIQLYQFLEKKLNIKITFSHEEISASLPSNETKKYLNIKDEVTPVIIRKMLIHDEDSNKIAYSIGYYLSNKFVFSLNISR
ncbi:MAG: GntR family transcriptional regulator [Campylobacteraceae bacterium]|nr:GntR family transcriptional regulator [Campylobacteraceae bacterium]